MKVKVVERFIDKETRQLHEYGDVIEITKTRFDEISAAGKYVKLLGDDAQPQDDSQPQDKKPLGKMKVDELKEYAQAHGIELNESATKAEIIETIKTAENAE